MHAYNRFKVTKSVTNTWIADFNQFVHNVLFVSQKVIIGATISKKNIVYYMTKSNLSKTGFMLFIYYYTF